MVAGPFAQHPAPPSVVTSPPVLQLDHSFSPHPEFGPPWPTRFLEMPLDRYVNIVTAMINDGRFSHIGHGVLLGRRARLRVGVLYHVGNRTLTFHGSASTARQLPLFQDWTFATLASLPSVSQVGHCFLWPSPPPPPSSLCTTFCTPHRCQGCQEHISLVRRLTLQLEALQSEVHRMARAAASPPPSRPAPPAPPTAPVGGVSSDTLLLQFSPAVDVLTVWNLLHQTVQ